MRLSLAAAAAAASALVLAGALATTPAQAQGQSGKALFDESCAECHSLGASTSDAPTLRGVVGRKAASLSGFAYSDALKKKDVVWSPANLDAFLADPQAFAPGTAMYVSVASPADRKAIIDYLATVK